MKDAELSRSAALLLAGFGPFPGAPDNPSSELAFRIAADARLNAQAVAAPTTWGGAYEAIVAAAQDCAGVLLFGIDPGASDFAVEMRACNARALRPDAAGERPPTPRIDHSGPAVARSNAPIALMLQALSHERLPTRASSDAGDYICNYVLYRLLTERPDLVTGLVHLPAGADADALIRGAAASALAFAQPVRAPRTLYAEA